MTISRTIEIKQGKEYVATSRTEDKATVYKSLAEDLIAKKLENCGHIISIKRTQMYTYKKIVVTYDNNTRAIYEIEAR